MNKFKVIPDTDDQYTITRNGEVFSRLSGTYLKQHPNKEGGYYCFYVHGREKRRKMYTHKVVATLFLKRGKADQCINHIDGVKSNNTAENLEWCTYQYNALHAYALGLTMGAIKKISQFTKNGVFVAKHLSIVGAANKVGISPSTLYNYLNQDRRKSAGGYTWQTN